MNNMYNFACIKIEIHVLNVLLYMYGSLKVLEQSLERIHPEHQGDFRGRPEVFQMMGTLA